MVLVTDIGLALVQVFDAPVRQWEGVVRAGTHSVFQALKDSVIENVWVGGPKGATTRLLLEREQPGVDEDRLPHARAHHVSHALGHIPVAP